MKLIGGYIPKMTKTFALSSFLLTLCCSGALHIVIYSSADADLPVEQPTKSEFMVNLKAANQINLTIPPNVLARADPRLCPSISINSWNGPTE